jgi:hypothetical protein
LTETTPFLTVGEALRSLPTRSPWACGVPDGLHSSDAIGYITGPLTGRILTGVRGTIDSYEHVVPDVFGLAAVIMALAIFALARRGVLSSSRRSISASCSR